MFRGRFLLVPVLLIGLLLGGAIGAALSRSGDADREPTVVQVTSPGAGTDTTAPQVIEIHDDDWRHRGFFPFFIVFPIFFFVLVLWVAGGIFRGGWRGPGGRWHDGFEDWHRRQHAGDAPSTGSPPA